MEQILFNSIAAGIIIALIGAIYCIHGRRMEINEKATTAIGTKMDSKVEKGSCEEHRRHQTEVNMNIIERLARIETKMDTLLNGHGK